MARVRHILFFLYRNPPWSSRYPFRDNERQKETKKKTSAPKAFKKNLFTVRRRVQACVLSIGQLFPFPRAQSSSMNTSNHILECCPVIRSILLFVPPSSSTSLFAGSTVFPILLRHISQNISSQTYINYSERERARE